jgi:hypothetical protein
LGIQTAAEQSFEVFDLERLKLDVFDLAQVLDETECL